MDADFYNVVYDQLKRIAHRHLADAGARDVFSTTEVVHEAYLKLTRDRGSEWASRAHFFGAASRAMRQVLVDFARREKAAKRGGTARLVSLRSSDGALEAQIDEVLALDEALDRLDAVEPRLRQVVELRFFAGLSEKEIAELLGLTPRTVERDWVKARLFLLKQLEAGAHSKPIS